MLSSLLWGYLRGKVARGYGKVYGSSGLYYGHRIAECIVL